MTRHFASAAALLLLWITVAPVQAQSYPSKPIRLVVPVAAGGGNDTLGRYVAKLLSDALGQPVVVENRAGGGGTLGGEFVARAAPDGYTLLVGGSGMIVNTLVYRKPDVLKDYTAISLIGEFSSLLVAHPSLPARTVPELVKLAKARPGQLNYASSGSGSSGNLVMEMFRSAAGIQMNHIPYKGAGQAQVDVVAGQVPLMFANPSGLIPAVKAGRLRAIALSGSRRLSALPDVPTIAEFIPGFNATFILGLMGPPALPRDIVARLHAETVKIVQRRDAQEWMAQQGLDPVGNTPEQFSARIKADFDAFGKVMRDAGMQLNP